MANNTTVSVLMSTYNGENFILDQLTSLREQSVKINEVLIIDDHSTDKTLSIIKNYIAINDLSRTWKVIENDSNRGWKHNFISGLKQVRGDFIFFCDQDDIWFKNKVEIYKKILLKNSKINVLASKEILWNGNNIASKLEIKNEMYKMIPFKNQNYLIQCSGCTMVVRKKYLHDILRYYVSDWAHDDFLWKMAELDGSLALLQNNSILHRIHGTNESRKKRTRNSTIKGLDLDEKIINSLCQRIKEDKRINGKNNKLKILQHRVEGIEERKKLFKTRQITCLIKLILKYNDLYRRKRQILGDYLLAIKE